MAWQSFLIEFWGSSGLTNFLLLMALIGLFELRLNVPRIARKLEMEYRNIFPIVGPDWAVNGGDVR